MTDSSGDLEVGAYLYDRMKTVAEANGFESITQAIARALAAEAENKGLREALERQCDNMAFALNRVDLRGWTNRFSTDLAEDRKLLTPRQALAKDTPQ